jgi:hypothetical protein
VGKLGIIIKVAGPHGAPVSLQSAIYQLGFAWMASPKNASLIFAFVFLALMYAVCLELYRRRIFLRA